VESLAGAFVAGLLAPAAFVATTEARAARHAADAEAGARLTAAG
jgi:hypothetical protein